MYGNNPKEGYDPLIVILNNNSQSFLETKFQDLFHSKNTTWLMFSNALIEVKINSASIPRDSTS